MEDKSLRVILEHVVERHKKIDEAEQRRNCLYDFNVFKTDSAYAAHMQNELGLPAWDVIREILTSIQPVEKDIRYSAHGKRSGLTGASRD